MTRHADPPSSPGQPASTRPTDEAAVVARVTEDLSANFTHISTGRVLTVVVHSVELLRRTSVTLDSAASQADFIRALTATARQLLMVETGTPRG